MKETIIIFQKGEDSRKIQEYCFRQGCTWSSGKAKYFDIRTTQGIYIRICDNILTYGRTLYIEDAYYDLKVAYEHGKTIEFREHEYDKWEDCVGQPGWYDKWEDCVKPAISEESKDYMVVLDETEKLLKILVTPEVSSMPLHWYVRAKGPFLKCMRYAAENYCKRCIHIHEGLIVCGSCKGGCQGFKETEKSGHKRTRRMTNRELTKWLAQGNGQVRHRDSNYVTVNINAYAIRDEDKECPDCLVIRGWDDPDWHEPEVEV